MTEIHDVVAVEELTRMEISCPRKDCGTSIAFEADGSDKPIPAKCPSCGTEFGSAENGLREAVHRYRTFFRNMQSLGLHARFRIRVPAKD